MHAEHPPHFLGAQSACNMHANGISGVRHDLPVYFFVLEDFFLHGFLGPDGLLPLDMPQGLVAALAAAFPDTLASKMQRLRVGHRGKRLRAQSAAEKPLQDSPASGALATGEKR